MPQTKLARVPRVCENCGNTFEAHPTEAKRRTVFFCSRKCYVTLPIAKRFARYIGPPEPNGCILWIGTNTRGYGQLGVLVNGKLTCVRAPKIAWELANGPVPKGLHVLHNCPSGDNPACVNPAHLWLGTNSENHADKVAKGRQSRGEKSNRSHLTDDIVRSMRQRYDAKEATQKQLAEEQRMTIANVSMIVTRQTWKHVT